MIAAFTWSEWGFATMVALVLTAFMLIAKYCEQMALKAQERRREEEAAAVAAERRRCFLPKRSYTEHELRLFNGNDRDLPIALACSGEGACQQEPLDCTLPYHISTHHLCCGGHLCLPGSHEPSAPTYPAIHSFQCESWSRVLRVWRLLPGLGGTRCLAPTWVHSTLILSS